MEHNQSDVRALGVFTASLYLAAFPGELCAYILIQRLKVTPFFYFFYVCNCVALHKQRTGHSCILISCLFGMNRSLWLHRWHYLWMDELCMTSLIERSRRQFDLWLHYRRCLYVKLFFPRFLH